MKAVVGTLVALILTAVVVLIILAMAGAFRYQSGVEIPTPPPGYEYCTTDDDRNLGFCPKGLR